MWQEILTKILVFEYNMTLGFTIYVRLLYSTDKLAQQIDTFTLYSAQLCAEVVKVAQMC